MDNTNQQSKPGYYYDVVVRVDPDDLLVFVQTIVGLAETHEISINRMQHHPGF